MNGTNVQTDPIKMLRACLDELTSEVRKAAVWVLENQADAAAMSLRAIAKASTVHPNTVTRLTRKLGYASFKDFHYSLHRRVSGVGENFPDRAAWLQSFEGQGARDQLFVHLAKDSTRNVEALFRGLDPSQLDQAASQILSAKQCFVLGVGMAHSLAENFSYMIGMALPNVRAIPGAGELPVDALARAGPGDVVLAMTFKPYRTEVVQAVAAARVQGARIIALSDSPAAPILRDSSQGFIVPTQTPQFFTSTIALAAFLETLMAFVIANASSDAVANIKKLHERRHTLGIYWEKK